MEEKFGHILEGTISHVAAFGAFVKLPNGEDGLVHISEIAYEFITDIHHFVKIGDKVQVKVLGRNQKNKLELSIKRAAPLPPSEKPKKSLESQPEIERTIEVEPASFAPRKSKNNVFEDKISQFLKQSEEKQIDLRRNLRNKQGIVKKRKSS